MQDYAKRFYKSRAWEQCRASYIAAKGGLCERCLARGMITPGVIVHHKVYLSPENINNPEVSLNHDNLELLCHRCHDREHTKTSRRYVVDHNGNVRGFD